MKIPLFVTLYFNEYFIKEYKHHRFIDLHLSKINKTIMFVFFGHELTQIEDAKAKAFNSAMFILSSNSPRRVYY